MCGFIAPHSDAGGLRRVDDSRLAIRWRAAAAELRRYGAEGQATALEACAAELEGAERDYLFEELSLEQAAEELGVSYDTMGRRLRAGEIPNAGKRNRPRVRRCDLLPGKHATGPRPMTDQGEPDIAEQLLSDRG